MSEIIKLNYDDGYKNIELNGDPDKVIRINPTDVQFLERFANFDETADKIREKYKDVDLNTINQLKHMDENNPDFSKFKEAAENIDKLDKAMKELVNEVFGYDISSIVFGNENCLSPANGKPIFMNFMERIFEYIQSVALSEKTKAQQKIEKYTKPVIVQSKPQFVGMTTPAIDVSNLTADEKAALIKDLLK